MKKHKPDLTYESFLDLNILDKNKGEPKIKTMDKDIPKRESNLILHFVNQGLSSSD